MNTAACPSTHSKQVRSGGIQSGFSLLQHQDSLSPCSMNPLDSCTLAELNWDSSLPDGFGEDQDYDWPHSNATQVHQSAAYKGSDLNDLQIAHDTFEDGQQGTETANNASNGSQRADGANTDFVQLDTAPRTVGISSNYCPSLELACSSRHSSTQASYNSCGLGLSMSNLGNSMNVIHPDTSTAKSSSPNYDTSSAAAASAAAETGLCCPYPSCSSQAVFTRPCDLRKHYRLHFRKYACRVANCTLTDGEPRMFALRKDRDRHERAHLPSIPCLYCGRLFSRLDNLRDHCRKMHQD